MMLNLLYGIVKAFLSLLMSVSHGQPAQEPDFDFYVFAMSYQPEFCFLHRSQGYRGCKHPIGYWKTHLTIHGLWPERRDGSWPATCTTEPLDMKVIEKLKQELDFYWPNIKDDLDDPDYSEFWQHEWSKHGTCSGLSQEAYFQTALEHSLGTPDVVGKNYGKSISKTSLLEAYDNKAIPICNKGRYLQEIRACYGIGPDSRPTTLVPCPVTVLSEDNCGDEIAIAKFPNMQTSSQVGGYLRGSTLPE